ncbi:intraflagellar transport protein 43 homolog isoform X1 [Frankliniella occidentalis]|uniref:Intraflagellar transport protein 43 homolog isoform X1 n=1 Tax=Frankliniella occidentalis TaxID=133901 RepID=A0A6J1S0M8_FRAOC|nr:intraflagellar transport protein 43 homolog isoform X1 [Frankliniella occidentalis]
MEDEDLNYAKTQKAPARKGRRAAPSIPTSNSFDANGSTEDLLDSSLSGPSSPVKSSVPVAPPRSRRTGGWADETLKSAKSKHNFQDPAELERFKSPERTKPDSDDDIPVIPDLDDLQEDELTSQIAKAPSVIINRVATYKELDSDLFKHAAFATLDDMNLRLLTKRLNLEADVKEPDSCWTWDLLFTDVASDLNNELEQIQNAKSA